MENLTREKPEELVPGDSEDSFDMDYTVFKAIRMKEKAEKEAIAAKKRKKVEEEAAKEAELEE